MIDTPKAGVYYGGSVAAPMFASIVKKIYGIDVEKEKYEGIFGWKMPDLTGYTLIDVNEVREIYGIDKLIVHGAGKVMRQFPESGHPLEDYIEVWLGVGETDGI